MIRILHVVSILDVGGMESYIMNMYRRIDRTKIQFDFLVHHKRRGFFEDEIEALGGHVYHASLLDDFNLVKYIRFLRQLYAGEPQYRIVHGHLGSTAYWYLGQAKRMGIPWRILHAHCPGHTRTLKGYMKHLLFRFSPAFANISFACSQQAGKYQFQERPFELIPNGVDVERFRFSQEKREQMRSQLNLDGRFVVGHVGRFYYVKNHEYILKVFAALKKKVPEAILLLLGEGMLQENIKQLAHEMQLDDSVRFLGLQSDCAPYYQAMDAFILPSLYEGLPLAGIEAQCAKLPCFLADTMSPEARICPMTKFLSIAPDCVDQWADELEKISRQTPDRNENTCDMSAFDVSVSTSNMIDRYQKLWESAL